MPNSDIDALKEERKALEIQLINPPQGVKYSDIVGAYNVLNEKIQENIKRNGQDDILKEITERLSEKSGEVKGATRFKNKKIVKALKEQDKRVENLATMLKTMGVKNLRMTSLGNSIGAGYSVQRNNVIPLLSRIVNLKRIMGENGVTTVEEYNAARGQNNSDEKIFGWITENVSQSEFYKMIRSDFSGGKTSMETNGLTKEQIEEYYPTNVQNDVGVQDEILESDDGLANIVIYNGCTGSFLDEVTRGGNFFKAIKGISKDVIGLEATLKLVQSSNRNNNTNTQIYICGAPDYLGLKISGLINRKLKKTAEKYANTVYVKPVKSKFLYKDVDSFGEEKLSRLQKIFKSFLRKPDIHYDEEEYVKFTNNILGAMNDNYQTTKAMINTDRTLYNYSKEIELNKPELFGNNETNRLFTERKIQEEASKLPTKSRKEYFERAKEFLIQNGPSNYFYLGGKNIRMAIDKVAEASSRKK